MPASPLHLFHPRVRAWFTATLGAPSDPQRRGWPAIATGRHTLILAPTGTGKTLAAFLYEVDRLIRRGLEAPLPNGVQILYVSPLKALSNDIHRNLERPLAELRDRFVEAGLAFPEIRVAVRTGDTPASARARMTRRAPHILITTPESLNIMLTTVRGRGMFATVRAVIVDEIHAVAGTKRGAHLALTLERLETLAEEPPQRIGLSATQRPLDEIARFLGGCEARADDAAPVFRPVTIVDCGLVKRMELEIASSVADMTASGGIWPHVAALALERIRGARTTLVFVNNRGQAERMAARINALAGDEIARPYHGALAKERRLALERALQGGELRALVTTSALELGIDIGSVDLVLQLQSPKRVSAALQRVGRAGHSLGESSHGVLVPTFREDLMEMAAIVEAMREGDVEPTRVPQNALDVLAQTLVAMAAVDEWSATDAFALVRRAYPYHGLGRAAFDEVLAMLAGKYATDVAAELEPRLTWDPVNDRIAALRGSRLLAVVSGGTIPDRGLYTAVLPDRTRLGELDEEFVHESRVGDVFQLGSATWRIGAIERDRVIVTPAPGAPARMPFWHGEYATRSAELSRRLGALRRTLTERARDDPSADESLAARLGCDVAAVGEMREYIAEQRAATGVVPDDRTIVVEHFRDDLNAVRIVVHSVFGGRVNAPWGMALAQRVREVLGGVDCQVQTSDDGILLRLPDLAGPVPVRAILGLGASEAESRVIEEVGRSSLFGARFRMNATRALILARGTPRRRMPLWLQRLRALDLLEVVRQSPSFPILVETYREILGDAFDVAALKALLDDIAAGRITIRVRETPGPSPFAAGLQLGFVMEWLYADDTPRAERQAALLSVDRGLLADVLGEAAPDDDTMRVMMDLLADRRGESPRRKARSGDELAVLIDRAGDLDEAEVRARVAPAADWAGGRDPLAELLHARRVVAIAMPRDGGEPSWRFVLADSVPRYAAALGAATLGRVRAGTTLGEQDAADVLPGAWREPVMERDAARREILSRYLGLAGPVTLAEISARYPWPADWIESRLAEWERSGRLVRGRFRSGARGAEWCARTVAERARRRALAALRREIEAVSLPAFAAFLQRWQHVDPRDRLDGPSGLEVVIKQLSGIARPVERWEREYLPSRLERYDPAWLSQLAATGRVAWAGAPRRQGGEDGGGESDTPVLGGVRFFSRGEEALWLRRGDSPAVSGGARTVQDALARLGASFFDQLQRETGLAPAALRGALYELVAVGLATNDTVEAMREVARWRALPVVDGDNEEEAVRWLPDGFERSLDRPVVQRRPNLRRLPKWRRPDALLGVASWSGRWSLLEGGRLPQDASMDEAFGADLARYWLDRYGIVTLDWWRREHPPVGWRAIYRELKRLEYRGDVRRGYFVEGLAGAQFALPAAVELLRGARQEGDAGPVVAVSASDPSNPYSLRLELRPPTPLERPRGGGAFLVTRGGVVLLAAEAYGRRIIMRAGIDESTAVAAAAALGECVTRDRAPGRRARCLVEMIDGEPVTRSRWHDAFQHAGFRRGTRGVEFQPLRAGK